MMKCPFCNKEMKLKTSKRKFIDENTNKKIKYEHIYYECRKCSIELCNKEMVNKNLKNIKRALELKK